MNVKERVIEAAREAGASAVAIASADDDPIACARFEAALERGDLATWPYDGERARAATSPRELLPRAKSVVCVAISYATQAPAGRGTLTGRVSNYAWSVDYHRYVRAILNRIAARLDALAEGAATVAICDTAPFAERAFGARAGLGWIGKHTNLIAPGAGSYVFLGEILTTLELEPDRPSKKSCGNCRRCVEACPTGALRGDYTIDATRCISDLTQRTDGVPRGLRTLCGDWVWGCDLCQDVCPPTRRAGVRADREFDAIDAETAFPDLVALLGLTRGTFRRRFRSTAMGWRGAAVLRRNAAVALGNSLDRAAVPALERALSDDRSDQVRGHAAWALGRIGSPRARAALGKCLSTEQTLSVREEITHALGSEAPPS